MSEREHVHPPQQPDVLAWKWLAGIGAGTVALTVALGSIAGFTVRHHRDRYGGEQGPGSRGHPVPEPPARAGLEFVLFEEDGPGLGPRARADERARLRSWGWVDRGAGRLHLPIDLAIEHVAGAEAGSETSGGGPR